MGSDARRNSQPAGVRLIVVYKFAKALLQLTLAATLTIVIVRGGAARLHEFALALFRHGVSVWSLWASKLLLAVATEHRLELAALALALDAILSSIEGYSLARGYTWGPWLVVVATGSLVPWEIVEVVRTLHFGRVVVLAINLCIVVYLTSAIRRRHARRAGSAPYAA